MHIVGTPIGIIVGLFLCFYAKNSKLVIGKPYSCSDWIMVNSFTTIAFVFVMIMEWSAYSVLLYAFGDTAENNVIVFLMKKGCLVPFFSCAVSCLWGKLVRKFYLDYAEDYSSATVRHCLTTIVAMVCLNVQYILLPGIDDVKLHDFMQDSVVAWALMGVGTIFALGAGCEGRRNKIQSNNVGLQGYGYPILSAVIIGGIGVIASLLGIAYLAPSFIVGAILTSLVFVLIFRIRQTSLKRFLKRLRKANRKGFKKRKYRGRYYNLQFCVDGEWLVIGRDNSVKYRGDSKEFDELFGSYRHRIGTQISSVISILSGRYEEQRKFIDNESKRAIQYPDLFPAANERFAKDERV